MKYHGDRQKQRLDNLQSSINDLEKRLAPDADNNTELISQLTAQVMESLSEQEIS